MCFRPTTTVLATLNTTDFLYTCDAHLTDQGFASPIEPPPPAVSTSTKKVSDEEIRRIKEEWEERQKAREKQRQEKDKAMAGDKDTSKDGGDKDARKESGTNTSTVKASPPPPSPIPVPQASTAKHQRYTLHRDVWSMRLAEHRKKRQTTAVRDVAPRLPMTPRGGVS